MQSNESGIRSKRKARDKSRKGKREEESGNLEEVGIVCGVCSHLLTQKSIQVQSVSWGCFGQSAPSGLRQLSKIPVQAHSAMGGTSADVGEHWRCASCREQLLLETSSSAASTTPQAAMVPFCCGAQYIGGLQAPCSCMTWPTSLWKHWTIQMCLNSQMLRALCSWLEQETFFDVHREQSLAIEGTMMGLSGVREHYHYNGAKLQSPKSFTFKPHVFPSFLTKWRPWFLPWVLFG